MNSMSRVVVGIIAIVLSVCTVGAIAWKIRAEEMASQLAAVKDAHLQERQTEAKILAFIVRRNPQATIRDFSDFPAVLLEESARASMDFRLILAIIDKESEFNPRAVGKAGEIGLMQLMPGTASIIAKNAGWPYVAPSKRRSDGSYAELGSLGDPRENIRYGIAYLKDQVKQFGFVPATVLRGYNRGSAAAKEHRPGDRYAEEVALRLVRVSHELRGLERSDKDKS